MNQLPARATLRATTTARCRALSLIVSVVGILSVSLTTVLASPPEPPPSLCIEESSNCAKVATSGKIKWHPGHYLLTGGNWLTYTDTVTSRVDIPAIISEIASMPSIKGIVVIVYWGALEGAEGSYRFDVVDKILALCQASGKRLILHVETAAYSGSSVDSQIEQGRFPAYLRDTYKGLFLGAPLPGNPPSRLDAKIWLAPIMDRYIALHQALAARYDTHPYFEGVTTGETATSQDSPDYSTSAKLTQYKRFVTAAEAAWAHTNVFIEANSGFSDSQNIEFLQHMVAHRMILGGPDIRPSDFIAGGNGGTKFQRIYRGIDFGVDYRGQIACGPEIEGPNLGGPHTPNSAQLDPNTLMQFIYNAGYGPLQCSYLIWLRKTWGSPANGTDNDAFWTSAPTGYTLNRPTLKEFLSRDASQIPVVTTPPRNYPGVDTN